MRLILKTRRQGLRVSVSNLVSTQRMLTVKIFKANTVNVLYLKKHSDLER